MTAAEVLLDGRVMRPDGSWSGLKTAGEVVRARADGDIVLRLGEAVEVVRTPRVEPLADVFYFETFMERVERERARTGGEANHGNS